MSVEHGLPQVMDGLRTALRELRNLPTSCNWRIHAGHVTNPHDPGLDIRAWPTLEEAAETKLPPGPAWMCATVEVPAHSHGLDLVGSEVGVHAMGVLPVALYVDGRFLLQERYWSASGPALLSVAPVSAGGKSYRVVVHTEIPGSGIPKGFDCGLVVERVARTIEELEIVKTEFEIAHIVAQSPSQRELVSAALAAVDLGALASQDWDAAFASFAQAEAILAPLSSLAKEYQVHLVGHAHIDMNWMWDWKDTVDVIVRDVQSVLGILRDYPEATFSHSQVATYKVMQEQVPALFAEVKQRIAEGRWEVTASTWVEGDLNMATGESLARQHLQAIRWCRDHLGVTPTTMWEPDTFGHPATVPQVARLAGIKQYFHMRCNPGVEDPLPAYIWEGVDGTRLFVASRWYNGTITPSTICSALLAHHHKLGAKTSLFVHGVGDHGGGPARADLDRVRRMQERPLMPTVVHSTFERYAASAQEEAVDFPTITSELNFIFEGCYTTHADIKEQNRQGENSLLTAETLAALTGTSDQEALDSAWQLVAFNQFHDIFDGSGIVPTYTDSAADAAQVEVIAEKAVQTAVQTLLADTPAKGCQLMVTNSLAWPVKDAVRVRLPGYSFDNPVVLAASGQVLEAQWVGEDLLFVAELPACGYRVFTVKEGSDRPRQQLAQTDQGYHIDTNHFRALVLDGSGIIGSLYDKRAQRELVAYGLDNPMTHVPSSRPDLGLNVFQIQDERPHSMTAWLIDGILREENLIGGATVQVKSHGPVATVLSVEHRFRSSSISQEMVFYQDLDRIDFPTVVDWREIGDPTQGVPNLKVAFTADLSRPEATYQVPYGTVVRTANGQERPSLHFVDISNQEYGISVQNDTKYGYDVLGSRLRLSLLRSPYDPDPLPDVGLHRFCYSLYPHAGSWREADVVRRATAFNQKVRVIPLMFEAKEQEASWLDVTGDSTVIVSAIKASADGDGLIVRCYDSTGQGGTITINLAKGPGKAALVDLMEESRMPCPTDQGVTLTLRPWEIKTVWLAP